MKGGDIMNEIEEILAKIDEMRKSMCDLIEAKDNLVDLEVVQASQNLDSALNEYHDILESIRRRK